MVIGCFGVEFVEEDCREEMLGCVVVVVGVLLCWVDVFGDGCFWVGCVVCDDVFDLVVFLDVCYVLCFVVVIFVVY